MHVMSIFHKKSEKKFRIFFLKYYMFSKENIFLKAYSINFMNNKIKNNLI